MEEGRGGGEGGGRGEGSREDVANGGEGTLEDLRVGGGADEVEEEVVVKDARLDQLLLVVIQVEAQVLVVVGCCGWIGGGCKKKEDVG